MGFTCSCSARHSQCRPGATEAVFASLNQTYKLPLNEPVRVTLPASKGGTLSYECGMKMFGGRIVLR